MKMIDHNEGDRAGQCDLKSETMEHLKTVMLLFALMVKVWINLKDNVVYVPSLDDI